MSEIFLIRPGCTDFDEQSRLQGSLDLPLNQRGEDQVARLIRDLTSFELDFLFTSPTLPAQSTAETLQRELDIRMKVIPDWSNLKLGLWEGLPLDEVRRKHPRVFKQWMEEPRTICPPEGETIAEAQARIRKPLERAIRKKSRFGIVAPEPLASVIRCTLLDERPEFQTDSLYSAASSEIPRPLIERIHCSRLGDPGNYELVSETLPRGPVVPQGK